MAETLRNESDTFDLDGETTVHRLGYGAMRITGEAIIGPPEDEAEAKRVVRRAVELGVDFVDTADSYGPGVSERLLGEELDDSDGVTVATKAGLVRHRNGDWQPIGEPKYLHNQVLCSLDRLGVDTIDLYQFHRPDPDVDFEDSIQAFAEMKDAGQIRHIGLSNVTVDQLETALDHVEVATVQNRYNVGNRDEEDVLRACEDHSVGFIPWRPLPGEPGETLEAVAEEHGATPRQIALAWLLDHSDVTLPIPGTSSVEHLEQNVAATAIDLSDDEVARLRDVDPQ
jgi:aryl-alcohol dehydrogenase-like predicted oxidoreductase